MFHKARILQLTLMTLLLRLSSAAAEVCTEKYSSKPVTEVVATGLASWAAQSVFGCALRCKMAASTCQAFAFVATTQTCISSAVWNADFSVAAPGAVVFRKPGVLQYVYADAFVQIGNRTFRVIQQRSKGNLSFARNWTEYEDGFGDDTGFWLGLKSISNLTANAPRVFRAEAVTWAGVLFVSEYSGFTVGDASTAYTMTFSSYLDGSSNDTYDSLTHSKGMKFSTAERDNDLSGDNCAANLNGGGGWWFKGCTYANSNGIYRTSAVTNGYQNMFWHGASGWNALKSIRLMLQV